MKTECELIFEPTLTLSHNTGLRFVKNTDFKLEVPLSFKAFNAGIFRNPALNENAIARLGYKKVTQAETKYS